MSDESTLRKAVTTALVFLENARVTEGAVALRDVAGARPLITSLRSALAAPSGEIAVKDRFSGLTMNGAPLRPGDTFEIDGERYVFAPAAAPSAATGSGAATGRVDRPEVVCLCGSTRFIDTFMEQYGRLTDDGKIVLTVGRVVPQSEQALGSPRKAALDTLHLRKIDFADRVLVLNVGGYVGPSTRREIAYAKEHGKPIDLLYPDAGLDGPAPGAATGPRDEAGPVCGYAIIDKDGICFDRDLYETREEAAEYLDRAIKRGYTASRWSVVALVPQRGAR